MSVTTKFEVDLQVPQKTKRVPFRPIETKTPTRVTPPYFSTLLWEQELKPSHKGIDFTRVESTVLVLTNDQTLERSSRTRKCRCAPYVQGGYRVEPGKVNI